MKNTITFTLNNKKYKLLEEKNNFFKYAGLSEKPIQADIAQAITNIKYELIVCKEEKTYLLTEAEMTFLSWPYLVTWCENELVIIVPLTQTQHDIQES